MAAVIVTRGWANIQHLFDNIKGSQEERQQISQSICQQLEELGTFSDDAEAVDACRWLNTELSRNDFRLCVFDILHLLSIQCTTSIFLDNCNNWIKLLKKYLQPHHSHMCHTKASTTLAHLLDISNQLPELRKEIATNHISPLLNLLLSHHTLSVSTPCLLSILTHYPACCATSTKKLLLTHLFSSIDRPVVPQDVVRCITLIPHCGPSGHQGVVHVSQWNQLFHSLHNHVLHLFHLLTQHCSYITSDVVDGGDNSSTALPLPPLPSTTDPYHTSLIYSTRLYNASICLHHLLSTSFPYPITDYPTKVILNTVATIFAVDINTVAAHPHTPSSLLLHSLPKLHEAGFLLVEGLLLGIGSDMIEYCEQLNRLYLQHLERSKMFSGKVESQMGTITTTLSCSMKVFLEHLCTWFSILPDVQHSLDNDQLHQLISKIMYYIKPKSPQAMSTHTPSKKASKRRKLTPTHSLTSMHLKTNYTAGANICSTALQLIRTIVYRCGDVIRTETWTLLHTTIVSLLLEVQGCGSDESLCPRPYVDVECRVGLYRLLQACVLKYNPVFTLPPLQPACTIFNVGRGDADIKVSEVCKEALCVCDMIMSPRVEPLPCPLAATATSVTTTSVLATRSETTATAATDCEAPIGLTTPPDISSKTVIHYNSEWSNEEGSDVEKLVVNRASDMGSNDNGGGSNTNGSAAAVGASGCVSYGRYGVNDDGDGVNDIGDGVNDGGDGFKGGGDGVKDGGVGYRDVGDGVKDGGDGDNSGDSVNNVIIKSHEDFVDSDIKKHKNGDAVDEETHVMISSFVDAAPDE